MTRKLNLQGFFIEDTVFGQVIKGMEFIDKIKVSLDNLLVTRDKGITEGVSNIFIENMNKLSVYERPLHCTDVKREIVYIKSEENQNTGNWERDDSNLRLKNALKQERCCARDFG